LAENVLAEMDFCKIDTSLYIKVVMFDVKCKETSLKKTILFQCIYLQAIAKVLKNNIEKQDSLLGNEI
jgi:hypothetical protein